MKINIFGYSIEIKKVIKLKLPITTDTYLTFDKYVNDYNCSYYQTPTNYD
jgi:hypothetical protein